MGCFTFIANLPHPLQRMWARWVWCDFDGDHVCRVALLQQNKLRRYLTPPVTSTPPTILLHSNPLPATQDLHSEYHRQERGSSQKQTDC